MDNNSEVPNFNIKFCPECGAKVEKPTIRCMHCGEPFVDFNAAPNEGIIQITNKDILIKTKHIDKDGLSFDYPEYYLIANIPPNDPDCVVALAKDDGLCDIMVEVSSAPKMQYQEGIFEKRYGEYIKNLGFYDFTVIHGFGPNKTCVQAYSNTDVGIVKSTVYFDLNYAKDLRIILNTLSEYDYDCRDDLRVIAKNLSYNDKNENKNDVISIFAVAFILFIVALLCLWILIIPSIALFIYGLYIKYG